MLIPGNVLLGALLLSTLILIVNGQLQQQPQSQNINPFNIPDSVNSFSNNLGDLNYVDINRQNANRQFVDRRSEQSWWNLYPFGELFWDREVLEQPSHDTQIDLDFYFPFYGFRFNYTFIIPNGILAFSRPQWIQPPYTFPNPYWPNRRDPSFVAPFFSDSTFQFVGETGISHVWYRSVHRNRYGMRNPGLVNIPNNPFQTNPFDPLQPNFQNRQNQYGEGRRLSGYVEDDYLLDNITRDIQEGIVGAQGFRADHALIVTWERMAYGGAPKVVDLQQYDMQNTYQVVLASDEIRSYVMLNYATLNWTSSTSAGGISGRGGRQSAICGFNGGNGTGFTQMPYNGQGEIYKLAQYSSGTVPGRWVYRVDEEIIRGGCNNDSIGIMSVAPTAATMLGGLAVNISGPCIRHGDQVVAIFDQWSVNCEIIDTGRAKCVLPNFLRVGMVDCKFSRDGGQSFPYVGVFYILQPDQSQPLVQLWRDEVNSDNNFNNPYAQELTLKWAPMNLTSDRNARVNIELWGYWENLEYYTFRRVGIIAEAETNDGSYTYRPSSLIQGVSSNPTFSRAEFADAWRYYQFGSIRVSQVRNDPQANVGNIFSSHLTPFSWYFKQQWEYEYGSNWALDLCIEWFDYDGRRDNFIMDLEPCPCVLQQAILDMGRFMPVFDCNMDGDSGCPYHRGAKHCVMGTQSSWLGSQQVCCYDVEGWLMMSDDYEFLSEQLKYFSPGTPFRSNQMGAYPYRIPPYVPSMSNYFNDRMPYQMCCVYSKTCQFYFWRRQSNGCQGYRPPGAGFAYGDPHFVTMDGVRYTFNGKGYFVLAMADHPWHKLMVQVRMEQPPVTMWGQYPNATVITGVAIQENDSDVVQILARKEFRRWRYRMDITVRGIKRFFDQPEWKYQVFKGVSLYNPARNMNQSEIIVQLASGAGIRVSEAHGILDVMVLLPPSFNQTQRRFYRGGFGFDNSQQIFQQNINPNDGSGYFQTMGLLGVYNNQPEDDFYTMQSRTSVITPNRQDLLMRSEQDQRSIYDRFGLEWRVTGADPQIGQVLFQSDLMPIYNPLLFSENDANFQPKFDLRLSFNSSSRLIFSDEMVRSVCNENEACMYDYLSTGVRELALNTLDVEKKFLGLREYGTKELISCGPLLRGDGVIKRPVGNNYLHGVKVTFDCEPEFFLHGERQRSCINGTWTSGWHAWCRSRSLEYFLKWLTGILTSAIIVIIIACVFLACYWNNVRPRQKENSQYRNTPPPQSIMMQRQPQRLLATAGGGKLPYAQSQSPGSTMNNFEKMPQMMLDTPVDTLPSNNGTRYEPPRTLPIQTTSA